MAVTPSPCCARPSSPPGAPARQHPASPRLPLLALVFVLLAAAEPARSSRPAGDHAEWRPSPSPSSTESIHTGAGGGGGGRESGSGSARRRGKEDPSGFLDDRIHSRQLKQDVTPLLEDGIDSVQGRFPYVVALLDRSDNQLCAGTIIDPHWVLTAAHCLSQASNFDSPPLGLNPQIKFGALNVSEANGEGGVEVMVGKGITHPKWNGNFEEGHDIALLRLPKPTSITPIALPAKDTIFFDGEIMVAMGWGRQGKGKGKSEILQWGNLKYRDNKHCNIEDWWNGKITKEMMCAGGAGQDVCKGDSGGPLIQAHIPSQGADSGNPLIDLQVGVISFREKPCEEESEKFEFRKPAVFTRVSEYLDWIEETMNGGSTPSPSTPTIVPTLATPTPSPEDEDEEVNNEEELLPDPVEVPNPEPTVPPSPPSPRQGTNPVPEPVPQSGDELGGSLSIAAGNGDLKRVEALVGLGADVDHVGSFGWSPLMVAANLGHIDVAQFLVDEDANLDAQSASGNTALMSASFNGHPQIVKILVKAGANVKLRNRSGRTARDLICQAPGVSCTAKGMRRMKRLLK